MKGTEKRLTWREICERYPKMWVGLDEVKFKSDNTNIESAIVAVAAPPSDYPSVHLRSIEAGRDHLFLTTFNDLRPTSGIMCSGER